PAGSQGVKVNQVIALLLEEGEDASSLAKAGAPKPPPAAAPAPAAAAPPPAPPQAATAPTPAAATGDRVFASPLARRMAQQAGLDLARLNGSGPHGRIVKADIDAALAGGVPAAAKPPAALAAAPAAAPPAFGLPAFTEQPHSMMRKVIARRLVESKREAPHFYLTLDCNIDRL